jgi:threonine aldolase
MNIHELINSLRDEDISPTPNRYLINLRSDVITLPTEEMYLAIREAPLGDDNAHTDPTVRALETMAARKLRMEAGIFLTSGMMANQVALLTQLSPGQEFIVEQDAHIFTSEQAAYAVLGGLSCVRVPGYYGMPDLDVVEASIRESNNVHQPTTSMICLENSHNRAGGTVINPIQLGQVSELAKKHGLKVHVDGARLFNAAVALGVEPYILTQGVDSVSICLSKGLSCPAGSVLCGSRTMIEKARRVRKLLGGSTRQAGILAAPGLIALETMISRLSEDHENASVLAQRLNKLPGIQIDMQSVQTNIIMIDIISDSLTSEKVHRKLQEHRIEVNIVSEKRIRLVTHRHFKSDHIPIVIYGFESVLQ